MSEKKMEAWTPEVGGVGKTIFGGLYGITPEGRVYSLTHDWRGFGVREMRQQPNKHGYFRVRLTVCGKRKSYMVHKLVAEHFLPPKPSPTHQIRHLDGTRTNNTVENLAWGTISENAMDRSRHGRTRLPNWNDAVERAKRLAGMAAARLRKLEDGHA